MRKNRAQITPKTFAIETEETFSIKLIQSKNNKICFQKGKNLWIHTIQVSKIQSISKFYTHL